MIRRGPVMTAPTESYQAEQLPVNGSIFNAVLNCVMPSMSVEGRKLMVS